MRLPLTLLAALLAAGCADAPDPDAPPTAEAPTAVPAEAVPADLAALESEHVETTLENEPVHVHRVALPAGAALAPHQGGARVTYALNDYTVRFETGGVSDERSFAEGDVHAHDAGVHTVENVGDGPAEFVVFERRGGGLPEGAAEGDTPLPTPGEGAADEVLLDDAMAEVHRVTVQPGARLPPHRGYARAVYSLSGYTAEFTGEGGTREERFEPGQAHYHDPGDHTVENAGDTAAEFLVVEFKR